MPKIIDKIIKVFFIIMVILGIVSIANGTFLPTKEERKELYWEMSEDNKVLAELNRLNEKQIYLMPIKQKMIQDKEKIEDRIKIAQNELSELNEEINRTDKTLQCIINKEELYLKGYTTLELKDKSCEELAFMITQ